MHLIFWNINRSWIIYLNMHYVNVVLLQMWICDDNALLKIVYIYKIVPK